MSRDSKCSRVGFGGRARASGCLGWCSRTIRGRATHWPRLRLENLDSGILDGEFPENTIRVSANADHFDLMSAEHVLQQVDELVANMRAGPALNHRQTP